MTNTQLHTKISLKQSLGEPTLADVTSFTDHVAQRRMDFSVCLSSRESISRIKLQLAPIRAFETARERRNRLKFTLLSVLICKFVCRNQRLAPGMLNRTGAKRGRMKCGLRLLVNYTVGSVFPWPTCNFIRLFFFFSFLFWFFDHFHFPYEKQVFFLK